MRIKPIKQTIEHFSIWMQWIVAGIILWYLFTRVDATAFVEAIRLSRFQVYLPLSIGFVLLWFLIESQNLSALFTIFGHRIPFREMRLVRGATYLLMIINYNLGLGGVALYMKKRSGIALSRTSSIMLFYYFAESVGITFFAAAGGFLIMKSGDIYIKIALAATFLCVTYLFLFAVYRFYFGRIYSGRNYFGRIFFGNGLFKRLSESALLTSFREVTFSGYARLTFFRIVYFASFIVFFYFGLRSFHISVPFLTLIALVPAIFFLGNIPVTPFGLGTIQASMIYFFKDFGSSENILAFSVVYSATLIILRAPIGIVYMYKTTGRNLVHADSRTAL